MSERMGVREFGSDLEAEASPKPKEHSRLQRQQGYDSSMHYGFGGGCNPVSNGQSPSVLPPS